VCSCVVFLQLVWSKITTLKRKVLHPNFLRSNFFRAVDPLVAAILSTVLSTVKYCMERPPSIEEALARLAELRTQHKEHPPEIATATRFKNWFFTVFFAVLITVFLALIAWDYLSRALEWVQWIHNILS
jgi:hypothetical protein